MEGILSERIITIIIPAYQAEKTIADVIGEIPKWISYIIVIDDSSSDHTQEIVKMINNEKIICLRHKQNRGVGGAMKTGFQKAMEVNSDIIIKMDSDGQMNPKYLSLLISPLLENKADYSKGNRFLYSEELRHMPVIRRIGNTSLSFFTKLASGYWNIFDPTNGYTAITKRALSRVNLNNLDERYFFESSMLLELSLNRIVVKDISIPANYNNAQSSLSELKSLFEFPPKLVRGFIKRITYLYFLLDFNAVSLLLIFGVLGCIFGSVWGLNYWIQSAASHVAASTGTVMISVLPIILGVQFLLQALVLDTQNTPKEILEDLDINE